MLGTDVGVAPITAADVTDVATFLEANMQSGVSARTWAKALNPPWAFPQPNHGFLLRTDDGSVVGAYLAFYSKRTIDDKTENFCNLAAWCVGEEHRAQGLKLLRKMLGQRGYHFTDLSPSGNVVALNTRLKFTTLDNTTAVVVNAPVTFARAGVRVITEPDEIESVLTGRDRAIYLDHRHTLAARHAVLTQGDRSCYILYRRDRRKRLPLFASILYVSDPNLFRDTDRYFFRHLLIRHGIPFTLVESRIAGGRPRGSILRPGRPRMYRSSTLRPDQIDYLYSELTCVPW